MFGDGTMPGSVNVLEQGAGQARGEHARMVRPLAACQGRLARLAHLSHACSRLAVGCLMLFQYAMRIAYLEAGYKRARGELPMLSA